MYVPLSVRKINIKCATNGSQVSDHCTLGYLFIKTAHLPSQVPYLTVGLVKPVV